MSLLCFLVVRSFKENLLFSKVLRKFTVPYPFIPYSFKKAWCNTFKIVIETPCGKQLTLKRKSILSLIYFLGVTTFMTSTKSPNENVVLDLLWCHSWKSAKALLRVMNFIPGFYFFVNQSAAGLWSRAPPSGLQVIKR